MGLVPSSLKSPPRQYPPEVLHMRQIIKERSQFPFVERMVFVLYCPPGFPLTNAANYISDRVNIPIFPVEQIENLTHEIPTNEYYVNGVILSNFSPKFQDVGGLKRQIEKIGMKMCLLFFEMDGATLSTALHKFDRWVHIGSNRSYHLCSNPPRSYAADQNLLLDDETGEPLVKLSGDSPIAFKSELENTKMLHLSLLLHFPNDSYTISGGSCPPETQRAIMKTLYQIFSNALCEKSHSTIPTIGTALL